MAETQQAVEISTSFGKHKQYLQMRLDQQNRMLVTPTSHGKAALKGRLWPVWLQSLLLEKSHPKFTYGVEISGESVTVSSSGTREELFSTVYSLAAQIRPLANILQCTQDCETRIVWNIRDGKRYKPVDMMIDNVRLPKGADLETVPAWFNHPDELVLHRERSCKWPVHNLKAWVEVQVALMASSGLDR